MTNEDKPIGYIDMKRLLICMFCVLYNQACFSCKKFNIFSLVLNGERRIVTIDKTFFIYCDISMRVTNYQLRLFSDYLKNSFSVFFYPRARDGTYSLFHRIKIYLCRYILVHYGALTAYLSFFIISMHIIIIFTLTSVLKEHYKNINSNKRLMQFNLNLIY